MAARFIAQGIDVPEGTSRAAGFCVDRDGLVGIKSESSQTKRFVPAVGYKAITAGTTLTYADSGKIIAFDDTTSIVAALPATKAGVTFTFVIKQLTTSGGHAISPVAADKIMGNGFTATDNKDAICSAATDRVGDSMTIVGDGVDGWFITDVTGTWARE